MKWRIAISRLSVLGLVAAGVAGCMPARPPPEPEPVAAGSVDLMHSKVDAYNAGLAAGKRLQARRDAAALAAAKADCAAPVAAAPAVPSPAAPNPVVANPVPPPAVIPAPVPNQAQVYTPGGPAVPVSPIQ
jgi:hypothetical protein